MNSISAILCLVKEDFLTDLKPKYVMTWLIQKKVITPEERLDIIAKDSSQEQVEKLFEILATKGSEELENFIKILNMEDEDGVNYPWLASKLKETYEREKTCSISSNVKKLLNDGGIPFQINHLLPRENVSLMYYILCILCIAYITYVSHITLSEIRDKLKQASNKRHWVVLYGMTGTGKSVFAAEAVRDNDLIEKFYPDGVFWLSLGILKDSYCLGIKMKELYEDISDGIKDSSNNKCICTVEDLNVLKKRLKRIVSSRKILVILDDLLCNGLDVVKYFDIGCPILVTTMSPALFIDYSDFTLMHECKNDLKIDESKKFLSSHAKRKVSELPPVVDNICKMCKGSPFKLSHIGKQVEPFHNNTNTEHWNYIYSALKEGFNSSIFQSNSSSEQRDIKEVITHIVPLENYKDAYLDFVIFPEDVWVPSQVFQVLWGIPNVKVHCTMNFLLGHSLVQCEKDSVNSYSYTIHDLYLKSLKEMCPDQSKRNEKLVCNYLKMCKKDDGSYDFSLLPDDDYIYYYIAYHMVKIENDNILDGVTLDDIYFDLKFIEKKLRLKPKEDLLWDYQHYKSYFKNKEQLEIYRSFVEKHMNDFNIDCDIIQLGLSEPENSIIYQKSLSLALKSEDKSDFK